MLVCLGIRMMSCVEVVESMVCPYCLYKVEE